MELEAPRRQIGCAHNLLAPCRLSPPAWTRPGLTSSSRWDRCCSAVPGPASSRCDSRGGLSPPGLEKPAGETVAPVPLQDPARAASPSSWGPGPGHLCCRPLRFSFHLVAHSSGSFAGSPPKPPPLTVGGPRDSVPGPLLHVAPWGACAPSSPFLCFAPMSVAHPSPVSELQTTALGCDSEAMPGSPAQASCHSFSACPSCWRHGEFPPAWHLRPHLCLAPKGNAIGQAFNDRKWEADFASPNPPFSTGNQATVFLEESRGLAL
ncbi:hypothetical protein J1605_015787 [Eschrichtius robustus]|uniref:Uncharacterized protein n=1 Tax=Eschrichtius robustus TaxID=9764 RepID=A0AB34G8Q3_ESCRO|nr:hypothetical protein J1605_015787 [Eschrichtius robustus]